uniref:AAA family ATPase n=1 Tax=Cohnella sp. REN36 TaxID=2887347 RepID=UPI001D135358|nr:AAA family ATPase [Cohnella sp. REN36]
MHIKELHIDGFGAWHDMRCRFDAPVTVVYGPNEAGKSTLLRFIRTMLYGFATRAQLPERGEPVRGGRHGGRLVLRDGDRELILERYADGAARRGGTAVLRDDAGAERTLTQAEVERLLLGGVSERLFRQLFAVTLDELHELRTLQGEEIGNYLYHAGMAGGAALTAAGKWLNAEMDRLYRPKGSTQTINLTLADMKAFETALRQSRQGIAAYREATARLAETDREIDALEAGLPALREREAFLRGALEARSWWLDAEAARLAEAELAAQLPPDARVQAPLGEEASARWETLLRRSADAQAACKLAEEALAELRSERNALVWDEALVAAASRIETLDARREAAVARRSELTEVAADLRLLEEAAAAALQRVSPAWTEDDARRFAAMAEREEGGRLRQRLAEAERVRDRIEAEAQRIRGDQAAIQAELAAEEEASASPNEAASAAGAAASSDVEAVAFVPRTREALLGVWHELEDELREFDRAGREAAWAAKSAVATQDTAHARGRLDAETSHSAGRVAARRRRANDPADDNAALRRGLRIGAVALAILGATVGIAAFASGSMEAAGLYGVLAPVLLAASGAALWLGMRVSRGAPGRAAPADGPDVGAAAAVEASVREAEAALHLRAGQAREALARLIARPAAVAAALAPDGRASGAEAYEAVQAEAERLRRWLRDGVQAQLDRWSAMDRAQARLDDIRRRGEAVAAEAARVERDRQTAETRCGECRRQWQDWLAAWKLPERLAPESLPELGQLADQALQQLGFRDAGIEPNAQAIP